MSENLDFVRRSWQQQPFLAGCHVALAVATAIVGIARVGQHGESWLTVLFLVLLAASFSCFVLLVRRVD